MIAKKPSDKISNLQTSPITDMQMLGSSGLKIFSSPGGGGGGFNYDEILDKLRFQMQPIHVYREISDNSSIVGTILYIVQALCKQCTWTIKPAAEIPEAIEEANFFTSVLADMEMTFSEFLTEALSYLTYGFSISEIVLKLRRGVTNDITTNSKFNDGRFGLRGLYPRSQEIIYKWELDSERRIVGLHQRDPWAGKFFYLPIDRVLHLKNGGLRGNPEGKSLLRNCILDLVSLKKIEDLEKIGIERDLCGIPTMEVPPQLLMESATSDEKFLKASIEKILAQLKNDERSFLLLPSERDTQDKPTGYRFRLLASPGTKSMDIAAAKNWLKTNILQSVLAQFVSLGTQSVGSFALAESHSNIFATALGSIMDNAASAFNLQVIDRLARLNKIPEELVPTLTHSDVVTPDLDQVGKYVQALASSGSLPPGDPAIISKLLTMGNLPVPSEIAENTVDQND